MIGHRQAIALAELCQLTHLLAALIHAGLLLPLLTGLNRLKATSLQEAALRLAELAEAPPRLTTFLGKALLEVVPPLPRAEAIEGLGLRPLPGLPLAFSGLGSLGFLRPELL